MSQTKYFCGMLSILFATLGLLLGVYGVFTCNAVDFEQEGGEGAISVGLFGYRTKTFTTVAGDPSTVWVSEKCVHYDILTDDGTFTYTTDKMTEALQAVAISLVVVGGVFTIFSCCVPCIPSVHPLAWKGMGLVFLVCCILQGVSLLVLDSSICLDNPLMQYLEAARPNVLLTLKDPAKCEAAPGFKFGISAVVFWFVAGALALVVPPPSDDLFNNDRASPPAPTPAVAAEPDVEAKPGVEAPIEKKPEQ